MIPQRLLYAVVLCVVLTGVTLIGAAGYEPAAGLPTPESATPEMETTIPYRPLTGPPVVAIQPGHWQIQNLPEEHAQRRTNIGAVYQGVREVDIALAVTAALQPLQNIQPIGREGEWYEIRIRTPALSGWVHQSEVARRQELSPLPSIYRHQ